MTTKYPYTCTPIQNSINYTYTISQESFEWIEILRLSKFKKNQREIKIQLIIEFNLVPLKYNELLQIFT